MDISDTSTNPAKKADLVLEGGGVKGIALAGAVLTLADAGYTFPRIAGTSAGAIVGAVLAALQRSGEPLGRLGDIARSLDYRKFRDRGFPGSLVAPFGLLADGLSVLLEGGAYEGDYLLDWLSGVLKDLGVETFGDLHTDDPGDDRAVHHRYGLVVMVSDLSRRRLAQLPWDYGEYGLDPDEQRVADAVRASASIPYFFEPVELVGAHGTSTLVDGGLISNYPIDTFDRLDETRPRWPTLGVRLDVLGIDAVARRPRPVHGPVSTGIALVETAIEANQAEHVLDPCNIARSVYVDTAGISAIDFGLDEREQVQLLEAGTEGARKFLAGWDFECWLATCRGAPISMSPVQGASD
ncbi:MAG TPA: patatin-like phospholipase family protein [Nocardioidaceae bacterium]|nr:patatin-like phospholipase family protein [Nocardioidaceae bacterium]